MRDPPGPLVPRNRLLLAVALGVAWLAVAHLALTPQTFASVGLPMLGVAGALNGVISFVVPSRWLRAILAWIVRMGYWRPLAGPVLVLVGTGTYLAGARSSAGLLASAGVATIALALTQFGMLHGVAGR